MQSLVEPSFADLRREADDKYIERLVKQFLSQPCAYYHLMVVNVPGLSIQNFNPNEMDKYRLEVIGGNHSRLAYQNIMKQKTLDSEKKRLYQNKLVKVYCGLSHEEAMRIGAESNKVHSVYLKVKIYKTDWISLFIKLQNLNPV